MRSLVLVLVLVTGCATHAAAKKTFIVGAAMTAVGLATGWWCYDLASRSREAPGGEMLVCPVAFSVLGAGSVTALAGGLSLALPEDQPESGSGSAAP